MIGFLHADDPAVLDHDQREPLPVGIPELLAENLKVWKGGDVRRGGHLEKVGLSENHFGDVGEPQRTSVRGFKPRAGGDAPLLEIGIGTVI